MLLRFFKILETQNMRIMQIKVKNAQQYNFLLVLEFELIVLTPQMNSNLKKIDFVNTDCNV